MKQHWFDVRVRVLYEQYFDLLLLLHIMNTFTGGSRTVMTSKQAVRVLPVDCLVVPVKEPIRKGQQSLSDQSEMDTPRSRLQENKTWAASA